MQGGEEKHMKKTVWQVLLCCCIIIISIITLGKKVEATHTSIENTGLEEFIAEEKEQQKQWREKYYNKSLFLENCMYIFVAILIFNVIAFSIMSYKGKKIHLIYKILQILFLLLIFVFYKIWIKIHEPWGARIAVIMPWDDIWRPIMIKFAVAEIILLFITLFVDKKIYIFSGSILFGVVLLVYNIVGDYYLKILPSIVSIIITSILFLPLYLKKESLEEEENVRL